MTLRDNVDGVIFRKWYESTDYNPQEALRILWIKLKIVYRISLQNT